MTKYSIRLLMCALILMSYACKKAIDIKTPQNQLTTDKVFADTVSAKSALFSIYVTLETQQYPNFSKYLSAYTDEAQILNDQDWSQSRITPINAANTGNWNQLYSAIYQSNMILAQLGPDNGLPAAFKLQLRSEAKFLRAYCYFILINLYGKVPLTTSINVNDNRVAKQNDSLAVYNQVLLDLSDAHDNLSAGYPGTGRIRANKACAAALLAKVYLYQRNYAAAENMASEILGSVIYTPLETVNNAFKLTGKEGILQLASQNGFTTEAGSLIPTSATVAASYYLTDGFYNSFSTGDLRKTNWIGTSTATSGSTVTTYHYPYKYKNRVANTTSPENLIILRVAEQYLIRAEARAYLGKLTGAGSASEDVNIIRTRAGLPNIQLTSLAIAQQVISEERRHELFFENGDRFSDLKRAGKLQSVMTAAKSTWLKTAERLPIPQTDITNNPNLIQNAGY